MFQYNKITDIFCFIDEFYKEFVKSTKPFLLGNKPNRPPIMSGSEVLTILVLFQLSGFRTFKYFYKFYVQVHMKKEFPRTVSYNRFVELKKTYLLPLCLLAKTCCLGKCTGISFVDSTPIRVCKNKRIRTNRVFKNTATIGKSTMGWFFGFKLHILVNDKGEILDFQITQANVDDRSPLKNGILLKKIFGKLYDDKGYVSKQLMTLLFDKGIHLVTGMRNNMKNQLMEMKDKILLRKRLVIETINDELKNICQIEHSRHRSFSNFIANLISGIIAYSFFPKKPAIKYQTENSNEIRLFY
ncbi:MAG: IS982 family transposase [Chitinophagales bacterium]